jgi:hypothetical protein
MEGWLELKMPARTPFGTPRPDYWAEDGSSGVDAFGRPVTTLSNKIDLPSSYPWSSERYRISINGTRTHIEDTTKVTDRTRDFLVEPDAGDTIVFRTAERLRYVVGFEGLASWGWQLLSTLGTGDRIRMGVSDLKGNGYYIEYVGDDTSTGYTATAIIENSQDGIVASESFVPPVSPAEFQRDAIQWNWYDVGRALFRKTYTEDGDQLNPIVTTLSRDGEGTTEASNLFLFFEIDAATSRQQLSVGSMSYVVLADVAPTARRKVVRYTGLNYGGSGDYEPTLALRVNQTHDNVFVNAIQSVVSGFDNTGGEAILIGVNPTLTDASGFESPDQVSAGSSVIDGVTNISTFPDGTRSESSSASGFGGYQINHSSVNAAGTDPTEGQIATSAKERAPIHSDDIAVLLVRPDDGTAQSGLTAIIEISEEW